MVTISKYHKSLHRKIEKGRIKDITKGERAAIIASLAGRVVQSEDAISNANKIARAATFIVHTFVKFRQLIVFWSEMLANESNKEMYEIIKVNIEEATAFLAEIQQDCSEKFTASEIELQKIEQGIFEMYIEGYLEEAKSA